MDNEEIDYIIDQTVPNNKTLDTYLKPFNETIGVSLFSDAGLVLDSNIRDFIQYIDATCPAKSTSTPIHRQAYVLYVLALCVLGNVPESERDDEFYRTKYFSILYVALTKYLVTLRRFLTTQDGEIYAHIESKSAEIIGFSLAVYNLSAGVVRSDTQKIFLKTFFIETSPFNIQDIHSYYQVQIQHVYYEYIKSKTQGLIPIEDLIDLNKPNKSVTYNRVSIYEQGIRNHRIKLMCLNSDTLKEIEKNYERLRGRILSNKFVSLFKQTTGIEIKDNKIALLYLNSSSLDIFEKEYSMVCKLLRSIRVRSDYELFTEAEKIEIRDIIYTSTFNKMSIRLGKKTASKLAAHLSQTIASDLVGGEYIDPKTMTRVIINTKVFTTQFQKFLCTVLESLYV